jgi:asparaginyl-tRNA synthetase
MTEIKQIFRVPEQYLEQQVEVAGWVRNLRVSKKFGFIELNDGSFFQNLQVVFEEDLPNFAEVCKLGISTALVITGTLVASPGNGQAFELRATEILLEGACPSDYPLQKKRHSFEYLRTIAHLRPRTNTFSAVFRLRSVLAYAVHQYFQERGFVYVHTPIITASDCEGAGEMFQLTTLDLEQLPYQKDGTVDYSQDFFGKEANLTVSGQLNAEAFAMAFGKVYTFGPTFRAENSNTARHAAEFWMLEPEIAFADLAQNMALAEDMMKYLIRAALERLPEEMAFFNQYVDQGLLERLQHILSSDFGRVTYTEAIEILQQADVDFVYPVEWGIDLQTEHER